MVPLNFVCVCDPPIFYVLKQDQVILHELEPDETRYFCVTWFDFDTFILCFI